MAKLRLSLACEEYDRTKHLLDGTIQPDDIELVPHKLAPQETFSRMLDNQEFDVAEMSISYYLTLKSLGKATFTAIPVFPMRMFFHTKLLQREGADNPLQVSGTRIGVEEYGMSLALWIRGILMHEFDIALGSVEWFVKSITNRNLARFAEVKPPPEMRIQVVPTDTNMMKMLSDGKIDVAYPYARTFRSSSTGAAHTDEIEQNFVPLFSNSKGEALRYFKKTGFFPMNHVVVLRNQVLDESPWVSLALLNAFQKSKDLSFQEADASSARPTNFVWLEELREEVKSVFGDDPFPYGFKKNRKIMGALAGYAFEQGIVSREVSPEELFAANTLDS